MNNKKFFEKGEANDFFKRNQKKFDLKKLSKPISLLCDWLHPFNDEIQDILEIGCGNGHLLKQMTESLNSKGFGVEPSTEAINYITDNFPSLEVKVGFGDKVPFDKKFDFVHLGFFLYLVDRELFSSCISEADRLVKTGGFLSIIDFETPYSYSNKYSHKKGVYSHKQNNSDAFVKTGLYSLVNKFHFSHEQFFFDKNIDERVSLSLLYKETKKLENR